MNEDPILYVPGDDPEPPHPAEVAWAERLHRQIGDWVSAEDCRLMVSEFLWLIGRDLRDGADVDLVAGRLVADGDEWVWVAADANPQPR